MGSSRAEPGGLARKPGRWRPVLLPTGEVGHGTVGSSSIPAGRELPRPSQCHQPCSPAPIALARKENHVEDGERRADHQCCERKKMVSWRWRCGRMPYQRRREKRAGGGVAKAGEKPEQGGFADPIGADDGRDAAAPGSCGMQVTKQRRLAIAEAESAEIQTHHQLSRRTERIRLKKERHAHQRRDDPDRIDDARRDRFRQGRGDRQDDRARGRRRPEENSAGPRRREGGRYAGPPAR